MEDFKRTLSNGWRVTEPYSVSKDENRYAKQMAEEIKAIPKQKIPPTTTQSASTQVLLDAQKARPEWGDEEYIRNKRDAAIAPEAQIRREDGSVDVGTRIFSFDEIASARSARASQKNTIGEAKNGSMDAGKRQKAIEAFTYSKPANPGMEDLKRLTELADMEAVQPEFTGEPKAQPKRPWWKFWARRFDPNKWDLHDPRTWRSDDTD